MSFEEEINKRKTFAIIAHPDAGKTTLTEKLLLFGGAIQTAGAVKSNKIKKATTSDFMEIEKQRGISVATSVMNFTYKGLSINILDTPGHKDFAEDTYRTLTAVDSVILVIDCVKGVEEQTRKLMEVCRMRDTPVIIFVNKMDREGKDPFDLLEEIEKTLHISVKPLSWPIGMGSDFKGVYSIYDKSLLLFEPIKKAGDHNSTQISNLQDPLLEQKLGKRYANKLNEDVELVEGIYEPFDESLYLEGILAPVFFGSGVNNFGVKELLEAFIQFAPKPKGRETSTRSVKPNEDKLSGFVFKIHANLDPKHRDRIAFLRICSGKFERNKFFHHVRLNKNVRFSAPVTFMGQNKDIVETAFPGDVVGLYDTGNFKIGDTLTEGEDFYFKGIPSFSPEIFRELVNIDPMKAKQLEKGISQLTDEGVAQLFNVQPGNRKYVGVVGELQFDVIQHRLTAEYGASCRFQPLNISKSCWITSNNKINLAEFLKRRANYIAWDKDENPVFLSDSEWTINLMKKEYPEIEFHSNSEFKT